MKLKISEDTRKEMAELRVMIEENVFPLPKPKRCKHCNDVLPRENPYGKNSPHWYTKGFCTPFCWEEQTEFAIKHPCATCGLAVTPFKRISAMGTLLSTGIYPKFCEQHRRSYTRKTGKCKDCKCEVEASLNKKGHSSGQFPVRCPDCKKKFKRIKT